jgi:hypothetical protein
MSCRYAQEWITDQLQSYRYILDRHPILDALLFRGLPGVESAQLALSVYTTGPGRLPPSAVEQVRTQVEKEIGPNGKVHIDSVYQMDTSGMGNIVFGYYMAALAYPTVVEDRISDAEQLANRKSLGHWGDYPDDIVQRRIGRELSDRTGGDLSLVTPELIISVAADVCGSQGSMDPGCKR